ncbi:hypothetical protein CYFUS_007633 [Cystobacter fuscus]|uniref:Ferritin-like domain-containing protein n=2 Tax=Cystobacter fuscus TaxID=43 RepID=A0A250JG78_9BACT|nr:hypothetical protein CYFUS_007633 [Cystobacter fuscus]
MGCAAHSGQGFPPGRRLAYIGGNVERRYRKLRPEVETLPWGTLRPDEAISIPLLRGTWRSATHPLVKGVLGRIVKDEAAHGQFGWVFLDWALPMLEEDEREVLREAAGRTIAAVRENQARIAARGEGEASAIHALGWMQSQSYLDLARRSMETEVLAPLRARGLEPL